MEFRRIKDRLEPAKRRNRICQIILHHHGDFGFSVFFRVEGDLRVKLVERLSPAGLAGIQRGWRITKINGNTNIKISNADFIVNNVFYSATSTFTFVKPDGYFS